jgi:hypothetical protein
MLLLDKMSKLKWHLAVVYGPAQNDEKENLLVEFAQVFDK